MVPNYLNNCCHSFHNSVQVRTLHDFLPLPACSQEKAMLDEIKGLAKKKEELQIRLEQAQNRMDLAM